MQHLSQLPEILLPWYEAHKRDLPWRKSKEPYKVWVSEIMLQQTRVEAVKGYYARFLEALPNVEALAQCPEEELYKLWEGLGYYSRVRNLQKAAQVVISQYGGEFPQDHVQVLALPGIGDYTAGAICSICFNQPTPAVDGNVLRLLSRLQNDPSPIDLPQTKKEANRLLAELYPPQAGAFTQALMELGATVCGPNRAPDCANCPCQEICQGYAQGTAASLPVKAPKKQKRQEEKTVFVLSCSGHWALEKRPAKGLLAGLWQFPNVPGHLSLKEALVLLDSWGLRTQELGKELSRKHIFTHIQWNMKGLYLEVADTVGPFQWFTEAEINETAALPTAFRQFWEER